MPPPCRAAYTMLFGAEAAAAELERVWAWMDATGAGGVDYVGWQQRLSLTQQPLYAERIRQQQQGMRCALCWCACCTYLEN